MNEPDFIKLTQYKGIDLFYDTANGMVHFIFEGRERSVNYLFEAERVINEPVWRECELYGYFVDGFLDKYIGTAKATRKDIKTGNPDWLVKGQYDTQYKRMSYTDRFEIYPRSEARDRVYREWEKQKDVFRKEMQKLNNIAERIKLDN